MSKCTEFCFIVPAVPPTGNTYVRHTKAGGHYKTAAADRFAVLVSAEWNKHGHGTIVASAYAVDIVIQLKPRAGRRDLDNFCKCGIDALVSAGAITDDSHITDLSLHKERADCDQTIYTIKPLDTVQK